MADDKLLGTVEVALIKDGWSGIKSLALDYEGTNLNIDIIADKLTLPRKSGQ